MRGIEPIRPTVYGWRGAWITSRTAPISTMRPAYITATRCAVSAITPMSCVISITAAPCSRAEALEERDDLRLDRDVERGGRLVGDQQPRLGGERERDHHALAHAAGELVRIVLVARFGRRDADLAQQASARSRASSSLIGRCVRIVSSSCRPMV